MARICIIEAMPRRWIGLSLPLIFACSEQPIAPPLQEGFAVARVDAYVISDQLFQNYLQMVEANTAQVLSTHLQKKEYLTQLIHLMILAQAPDLKSQDFLKTAENKIKELEQAVQKTINDDQLQKYYLNNKGRYDQIRARHILIRSERSDMSEKRQAKYLQLDQIRKELLQNPKAFAAVASKISEDPGSAARGGDLGFFTYGRMVPEFEQAAFRLQDVNEISPIVQTDFGYHIIQLVESKRGLEFHRELIERDFVFQEKRRRLNEVINQRKAEHKIQIYEDNLLRMSPLDAIILKDPEEIIPKDFKTLSSEAQSDS